MPTRNESTRKETGRPSDPGLAIDVRGLSRHYRHHWTMRVTRGVEDVTFEVPRGQVMGYLGPNGAGKTTTIKLLMGLIKRTAGEAFLLGRSIDEPMSGLDPFGRRDVRELILEQKEKGVTVLFSSHILPDVEMLCDRAAIVLKGKIDRLANVGDLVRSGQGTVAVRLAGAQIVALPPAWNGVVERRDRAGELELAVTDPARVGEVLDWALRSKLQVLAVTPQHASLEELFMAAAAHAQGGGAEAGAGERRSA